MLLSLHKKPQSPPRDKECAAGVASQDTAMNCPQPRQESKGRDAKTKQVNTPIKALSQKVSKEPTPTEFMH